MVMIDYGAVCSPDGEGQLELWNNARTMAHVANGVRPLSANFKGCECDSLTDLLELAQPYSTPDLGLFAPWYDEGDEDSLKFAGLLMLDITGIDDSFVEREVIRGFNAGGTFGPLRRRPKMFTFRALVIGSDHCGANYGLNYMRRLLHNLEDGCDFTDLNMFECCPCIEEDCDGNPNVPATIQKYLRTFKKVALLSGPDVTNRYSSTCGCGCGGCSMMEISWQMGVGSPFKFHEPNKVINGVTAKNFPVKCVEWFKTDADCSCGSEECVSCDETTSLVAPPRAPQIGTGGEFCSQPVVYAEECYRIYARDIPDVGESVLQVKVENGSGEPVYGVTVVVIPNANETPCDELDECDACALISVDCVPPYSTYMVDGTTRKAEITTDGVSSPCSAPVGTSCFPVLDPCIDHCVCVRFAGINIPANVKITVSLVARE